jgi:hypothetical protein
MNLNRKTLFMGTVASFAFILILAGAVRSFGAQKKEIIAIEHQNGNLSVDLSNAKLRKVMEALGREASIQIHLDPGVQGEREVTLSFKGLPLDRGLKKIIEPDSWMLVFSGTPPTLKRVHIKPSGAGSTPPRIQSEDLDPSPQSQEPETSRGEDTISFEDKELGIRFRYPASWGQGTKNTEEVPLSTSGPENPVTEKYTLYQIGDKLSFAANIQGKEVPVEVPVGSEIPFFPKKFDLFSSSVNTTTYSDGSESVRTIGVQRVLRNNLQYLRYFYIPFENSGQFEDNIEGAPPASMQVRYIMPGKKFDSLKINTTLSIELPVKSANTELEITRVAEEVAQKIESGIFDQATLAQLREFDQIMESIEFIE